VSTTTLTAPDGKMADLIAWFKSYDISSSKGCVRTITTQVDANTAINVSLYDTVENMKARNDNSARVATMKEVTDLGITVVTDIGEIVVAMPGAKPRVASDAIVASHRKLKIKAGQMDAVIALLKTPNPEPVMAGRRGGFVVKIDDTTLITHSSYNDQASLDAGKVKGALPHIDPAEIAKLLDGPGLSGTQMTGPVIVELYASRAPGAISTNFLTVADGKMDEMMAYFRAYDVRAVPGRFRMLLTQVDANTLMECSFYDTVESLEARNASGGSEGETKDISSLIQNRERFAGPVAYVTSGTGPRTYSDSKVASTRRMKVLPGKMAELMTMVNENGNVRIPGHRGAMLVKLDETSILMHSVYNDQASMDAAGANSEKITNLFGPFLAEVVTKTVGKIVLDVWA
jgi:hypothetical protein